MGEQAACNFNCPVSLERDYFFEKKVAQKTFICGEDEKYFSAYPQIKTFFVHCFAPYKKKMQK